MPSTTPSLVSVVLPARNAAGTVRRAVESIRAQTFAQWELLVIDDGSTDGTRDVLEEMARRDSRIRVLSRPPEGLVAALNAGLAVAGGDYVARMDADDEAHPDRLAEQVALLDASSSRDIGVASCLVDFGGVRAQSGGYALHVDWLNSLVTPEEIALNRFVESPLAHPSVMFRRELVARHGGYRAGDFPEDYELWLRWLAGGVRMAKVPRVLLTWHDGLKRLSRTDPRYAPEAFFKLKAEWIAREVRRSCAASGTTAARRLFVWGAGRPTRKRAVHLERHGVRIAGYIDVDAKKATPALGGKGPPVLTFDRMPGPDEAFVLGYVSSRGAREFIRAELRARGFSEGRDFLMCA